MKFHHSGGRKSTFKENPLRKIEAMKWSKCNPNLFSFSFFVSVVFAPYSARIKANCCSLTILSMNQNLEKAYDCLEWLFIQKTLEFFHIPPKLTHLFKNMIFSTRFNIMWNGTPLSPIITSRGYVRGDPLFLYLFILCLERLSNLLEEEVQDRAIHPVTFRG